MRDSPWSSLGDGLTAAGHDASETRRTQHREPGADGSFLDFGLDLGGTERRRKRPLQWVVLFSLISRILFHVRVALVSRSLTWCG